MARGIAVVLSGASSVGKKGIREALLSDPDLKLNYSISETTRPKKENEVDGIIRVYNNPICDVIDNYNCSAYYEPSYVIARAYQNGGF